MVKYLEICENNEWEGESWSYFIPYKTLSNELISQFGKFLEESDHFSLVSRDLTTENINYLMSRNKIERTSYQDRFNLLEECFLDDRILEKFLSIKDIEIVEMEWYKGNLCFL